MKGMLIWDGEIPRRCMFFLKHSMAQQHLAFVAGQRVFSDLTMAQQHGAFVAGQRVCLF